MATRHQLGQFLLQVDSVKGLQALGDLVARCNAALGPDHDDTLGYKDSLARAYEEAGRLDEAILLWKANYTLTTIKCGRDSSEALNRSDSLAAAYEKAGRIEEALRQWEESLRGRRKQAADDLPSDAYLMTQSALQEVARLHDQKQDYARAEPLWRELLQSLDFMSRHPPTALGEHNVDFFKKANENGIVFAQASLGRCLLHTGKSADAEPVLRQCLAVREKKDPDAWTTFHTKSLLGGSLLGQKKFADAEPRLLTGYEGMKQREKTIPPQGKVHITEAIERLVQLYEATGKKDNAAEWRRKLKAATDNKESSKK